MVEYTYNAWGEHAIETLDESYDELSQLNPFRYRGYYYDEETGLYFLKTRYYDPETGRFISIDDLSYIDPDTINGLNLYAYCGNNPVMSVDSSGQFCISLLLGLAIGGGAIIGGTINGVKAYRAGQRGWGLFGAIAGGALMGGAMGGILALGGMIGAAGMFGTPLAIGGLSLTVKTGICLAIGVGTFAGMASYSLENGLRTDKTWNIGDMFYSGFKGGLKGAVTFFVGAVTGRSGAYDKPFLKDYFVDKVGINLGRAIIAAIFKSPARNIITQFAITFGDFITKLLFVSSIAAGARKLIDVLLGG